MARSCGHTLGINICGICLQHRLSKNSLFPCSCMNWRTRGWIFNNLRCLANNTRWLRYSTSDLSSRGCSQSGIFSPNLRIICGRNEAVFGTASAVQNLSSFPPPSWNRAKKDIIRAASALQIIMNRIYQIREKNINQGFLMLTQTIKSDPFVENPHTRSFGYPVVDFGNVILSGVCLDFHSRESWTFVILPRILGIGNPLEGSQHWGVPPWFVST